MKKISLALIGLLTQTTLWSQDSTSTTILASDPTQVYTHIDFNGGINFDNFGPESWDFNLTGNIAFNNVLLGTRLPITNTGNIYSYLGDLEVFAGYKLFNRVGMLKSSFAKAGIVIPTSYEGMGIGIFPENEGFFNYYFNYTAGLQLTPKLAVYPLIGIKHYQSIRPDIYVFPQDSIYSDPEYSQTALNAGLTISYDFSPRSFVQFNMLYERGVWKTADGRELFSSGSDQFTRTATSYSLKYQYGICKNSFLYLQGAYFPMEKWHEPFDRKQGFERYKITLGYQHYLGRGK